MNRHISYKEFLAHCRKDVSRTRIYYTYFYHQATYPLSYLLYRLGFTANGVSIVGISISLAGGALIFIGWPILGTSLFLFSYLLDCCDGNIARIHYGYLGNQRSTKTLSLGMLLENFYPNISYPLFFIALGVYLYQKTGSLLPVWIAVAASVIKLVNRYTVLHASHLRKADVRSEGASTNKEIYSSGFSDEIKYFLTRVLDSARMYYVAFLAILVFAPVAIIYAFTAYMSIIVVLNGLKIIRTLATGMP